jgi:hypothetical protein
MEVPIQPISLDLVGGWSPALAGDTITDANQGFRMPVTVRELWSGQNTPAAGTRRGATSHTTSLLLQEKGDATDEAQ